MRSTRKHPTTAALIINKTKTYNRWESEARIRNAGGYQRHAALRFRDDAVRC